MDWPQERTDRLHVLWDEGHSTVEIGRRLGVSKNAVVGKAHRLDLPPRPSPIKRDPNAIPKDRKPVRYRKVATLAPLASVAAKPFPIQHPKIILPHDAVPPGATFKLRVRPECCWPIGEPCTRSFRFCDREPVPGKPYCTEHARLAYVKVRDRREDAA